MTKEKFAYIADTVGFVPEGEYEGVYQHPDCHSICIWLNKDGKDITINWGMEYSAERPVHDLRKRLLALKAAFDR